MHRRGAPGLGAVALFAFRAVAAPTPPRPLGRPAKGAQAFSAEDAAAEFNGDGRVVFFDDLDVVSAFAAGC